MDHEISKLSSALWDTGSTVEEQTLLQINNLWHTCPSADGMKELHNLIDTLSNHVDVIHDESIETMQGLVDMEEKELRAYEERKLDTLRVCEIKRIMRMMLLDTLGEPGLVNNILDAF